MRALLLAILVLALALPAAAQGEVRAVVEPSQAELTVGDVVTLALRVNHPAGWRLLPPELPSAWGDFEIRAQGLPEVRQNQDATETTSIEFTATLFAIGAFTTPPLPFRIVDPQGKISAHEAAPVTLTVIPTLAEGDSELRDIKGPWRLDAPSLAPVYLAALVLLAALSAVIVLAIQRRARRPLPDTRTPYQKARDELAQVESMGLAEQGRFQEYYQGISDTLRQLFEQAYNFPATDLTTLEIKRWLLHLGLSPEFIAYTIDVLKECDTVKFANWTPDHESARHITARAHQLILAMEPVAEARTERAA